MQDFSVTHRRRRRRHGGRGWPARGGPKAAGLPPVLLVDLRRVSLIEGVRAGFAIASVVALGQFIHWPWLLVAALGAMLTCLCDAGGPIDRRLPALFAFAGCGTLLIAGFAMLRATPAIGLPAALVAVFLASFARVYGQSAMQVGNLLVVVLVLAMRAPLPASAALALGATFLGGALWAILLTAVLWRLHPYRPARAAVAEVYYALARYCAELRRLMQRGARDDAAWDRLARAQRRALRELIEQARETVLAGARGRDAASGRIAQGWIRLETADQLFGACIALSELGQSACATGTQAAIERIVRMARLLRPILLLQGRAILADHEANRPGLDRAIAAIEAVARPRPPAATGSNPREDAVARVAAFIAERLRMTSYLSDARATLPPAATMSPARLLETARGAFGRHSPVLRHALRASLAAGIGLAATIAWPVPYGYWFTITLVLTMQPYFALTFTRALERIGGTVLGGLAAAAIAPFATTPVAMSLALFPLAVGALAVRAVSYGLFMGLLTPMVVLLSELGHPGGSQLTIALARAGFTVAGGLAALALAWVLWPAWVPDRLDAELSAAIRAAGAFAATEIAFVLGEGDVRAVGEARRAAGVASNALEVSLQRALLEPRRGHAARLEAALTIDAALRRMAGRLMTLQLSGAERAPRDAVAWRRWAAWLRMATELGLASLQAVPPRPELPADDPHAAALARIAGQIEVMAGAAPRLRGPKLVGPGLDA